MLTTAPKGTKDVLPSESYKWHYIENIMREVCRVYGYEEIRLPTFEHTELFLRGVGDTTDVVQKEMYTFEDKGGRSITLKPEATAGSARMFVEHALYNEALPKRLYYLNSAHFRYERPQAGRLREHHQFGVEAYGAAQSSMDAEVIMLAMEVLRRAGLTNLQVAINSIGCPKCRPVYFAALKEYLQAHAQQLCGTCRERMERNPLRALDCKVETCKAVVADAPKTINYLCEECAEHFEGLKAHLTRQNISYYVDPFIVRGLDYYTRTVFEVISPDLGAQSTVCGGGRYDGLIEVVGGPKTPGIGFGMGMERLLLALENVGVEIPKPAPAKAYIAPMGGEAADAAFDFVSRLRAAGVRAETDCVGRSLKAQLKYANKIACDYVVVIGSDELTSGLWKLRDMLGGDETTRTPEEIFALLCK